MTTTYQPDIYATANGTSYLKHPGVALIAQTSFNPLAVAVFMRGFGSTFDTDDYVSDFYAESGKHVVEDQGAALAKFAGQLCYLSLGEQRTRKMQKYIDNIKKQAHGSVLEHPSYSLLLWGIDRAVTHEIVRHRAGMAYSQVSQRYVSGKTLRFVERPEYRDNEMLHRWFEDRIDKARESYDAIAAALSKDPSLEGKPKVEARKAVNQAARSSLPNETEAPIVVTGNTRAWRHFIEMRASKYADATIRELAFSVYNVLLGAAPAFFSDYVADETTRSVTTKYRKV